MDSPDIFFEIFTLKFVFIRGCHLFSSGILALAICVTLSFLKIPSPAAGTIGMAFRSAVGAHIAMVKAFAAYNYYQAI